MSQHGLAGVRSKSEVLLDSILVDGPESMSCRIGVLTLGLLGLQLGLGLPGHCTVH